MSEIEYLAGWILAGFAGVSATLVFIFGQNQDAWIPPAGLVFLSAFVLLVATKNAGDSDA